MVMMIATLMCHDQPSTMPRLGSLLASSSLSLSRNIGTKTMMIAVVILSRPHTAPLMVRIFRRRSARVSRAKNAPNQSLNFSTFAPEISNCGLSIAEHRIDLLLEVRLNDFAAHLERRRELAAFLGERLRDDREPDDRFHVRELLVDFANPLMQQRLQRR